MAEKKKQTKKLRLFKQFNDAKVVAAITTTSIMDCRKLRATNESMEHFYNNCNDIQETEPTYTAILAPKRTKIEVLNLLRDQNKNFVWT